MGMLVLSRSVDQEIVLEVAPSDQPTRIVVTPTRVCYDKVRIGIIAPANVQISRPDAARDRNGRRVAT